MKCLIENCDDKVKNKKLSLCCKHIHKFKRYGNPNFQKKASPSKTGICKIEGCRKKHHAHGYCSPHVQAFKKHGDPLVNKKITLTEEERLKARKEVKRRYKRTEKGKVAEERYRNSEAYKKIVKKQNASNVAKERKIRYNRSERGSSTLYRNCALRRAKKRKACPHWVDKDQLLEIYKNCQEGMAVDHIIPLSNSFICGLHVPWNLQYLTRHENSVKSNKWDWTYNNESWRKDL